MMRRTLHRLSSRLGANIGAFGIAFIPSGSTGVIETWSKYSYTVGPGLNFYLPFMQQVRSVSNMVKQHTFQFECKTRDNIFVTLTVAAQYKVSAEDTSRALYQWSDHDAQIHAFLDSELRSQVSKRDLDKLFEEQDEISRSMFVKRRGSSTGSGKAAAAVSDEAHEDDVEGAALQESNGGSVYHRLKVNGFTLTSVLIRQIDPDPKVKESMNAINASLRMREAAKNEAEAKYIMIVKEAEADRDRRKLHGEGISAQRLAILRGYRDGVNEISQDFDVEPKALMDFIAKMQHLDVLETLGKSPNTKVLFMNNGGDGTSAPTAGGSAPLLAGKSTAAAGVTTESLVQAFEASAARGTPVSSPSKE